VAKWVVAGKSAAGGNPVPARKPAAEGKRASPAMAAVARAPEAPSRELVSVPAARAYAAIRA
jgi:hypothetical protein